MKRKYRKKYCVNCGKKTIWKKKTNECLDCRCHITFNNTLQRYGDL